MLMMLYQTSTAEQRERFKADLRALPYDEFLRSEYWMTVRNYVIDNANGGCVKCRRSSAQEVHHKSYRHHGEEHLHMEELMPVCRPCHEILQENFKDSPAPEVENKLSRVMATGMALADWARLEDKIRGPVCRKVSQSDINFAAAEVRAKKRNELDEKLREDMGIPKKSA